ncbi:hypothetical protein B0H10DRAFT_2020583 [Mycena sp. CBHHK59/15]|nr:hypothetical protein B0H10DRAFT_2020583 [Mycena sp. CBHHK59/15]
MQSLHNTPGQYHRLLFAPAVRKPHTKNLQSTTSDSPRQDIEFLTSGATDGTSWSYKWKYYLSSQTGTTDHFFHLMQILTRGGTGGPVITLNAAAGKVAIQDTVRGCPTAGCPYIALDDFTDRMTPHTA